jgi:hypothetical protein
MEFKIEKLHSNAPIHVPLVKSLSKHLNLIQQNGQGALDICIIIIIIINEAS